MKLVIDIDDMALDWFKNGYPNEDDMGFLLDAVINGKPYTKHNAKAFKECQRLRQAIENIKAEINYVCESNGYQRIHKDDVFKIIDNHIAERSEE